MYMVAIVQSAQIATLSQRLVIMSKTQLKHGTGEQNNEAENHRQNKRQNTSNIKGGGR